MGMTSDEIIQAVCDSLVVDGYPANVANLAYLGMGLEVGLRVASTSPDAAASFLKSLEIEHRRRENYGGLSLSVERARRVAEILETPGD